MLIQMLVQQPQMLGPIVKNTPTWVWGLLAALIALGLSQARARQASLARTTVLPILMTMLSLAATASAFGRSSQFGLVLLAWLAGAAAALVVVVALPPPAGTRYDSNTRTFFLPGSLIPLALVLAIFLVRYVVNVDVTIQPALMADRSYVQAVGAAYGFCSGIFMARAVRLWRLSGWRLLSVHRSRFWLQRDPW